MFTFRHRNEWNQVSSVFVTVLIIQLVLKLIIIFLGKDCMDSDNENEIKWINKYIMVTNFFRLSLKVLTVIYNKYFPYWQNFFLVLRQKWFSTAELEAKWYVWCNISVKNSLFSVSHSLNGTITDKELSTQTQWLQSSQVIISTVNIKLGDENRKTQTEMLSVFKVTVNKYSVQGNRSDLCFLLVAWTPRHIFIHC